MSSTYNSSVLDYKKIIFCLLVLRLFPQKPDAKTYNFSAKVKVCFHYYESTTFILKAQKSYSTIST